MDNPTSVKKAIKGLGEIKVDRIIMKIQIKLRNKMPCKLEMQCYAEVHTCLRCITRILGLVCHYLSCILCPQEAKNSSFPILNFSQNYCFSH